MLTNFHKLCINNTWTPYETHTPLEPALNLLNWQDGMNFENDYEFISNGYAAACRPKAL
jgi:hypothetical protein